jgi:L-ascorbate metabolism protein UlaG (beta-lactamase superfamily)
MFLRWLGHSCFLCEGSGVRLVTDPFDAKVGYPLPDVDADIVTVSHGHFDHNAVGVVGGQPVVLDQPGRHQAQGLTVEGWSTFHDLTQGKERGKNIIFTWQMDDLRICHLGDLGHLLDPETVRSIGRVDILMTPVGGVFTIDADGAEDVVAQLQPRLILPMHYRTPALKFELATLDDFIRRFNDVRRAPDLELKTDDLPTSQRVVIMEYPA